MSIAERLDREWTKFFAHFGKRPTVIKMNEADIEEYEHMFTPALKYTDKGIACELVYNKVPIEWYDRTPIAMERPIDSIKSVEGVGMGCVVPAVTKVTVDDQSFDVPTSELMSNAVTPGSIQVSWDPMEGLSPGLDAYDRYYGRFPKCECGSDSIGGGGHSFWCPKSEEV